MDFEAIAKARVADLLPGEKNVIWKVYVETGLSLFDLAYSPVLGRCARIVTKFTGLELTPGELYHALRLLGAY